MAKKNDISASLSMVKKLTIKKEKIFMIPLNEITLNEELENLFTINTDVLKEITQEIKAKGFDETQPLHLFVFKGEKVLIDGHTRRVAAQRAGLNAVYAYIHEDIFTIDEAKILACKLQINRRNLSREERNQAIITFHNLLGTPQKGTASSNYGKGPAARQIAEMTGSSPATVNRVISHYKKPEEQSKNTKTDKENTVIRNRIKKLLNSIEDPHLLKRIEHYACSLIDNDEV
jgi:uncharacterized protein YerC